MRRAFTWIELVVVIVIIIAFIVVLLPYVSKVREASATASCANHLRQFGIAHDGYYSYRGHFPPGTLPNPNLPFDRRLSFHADVLPYLELNSLALRLDRNVAWDDAANQKATDAGVSLQLFRCPSWGRENTQSQVGYLSPCNYVGVAGVGENAATRLPGAVGIGVFGYDRTTTRDQIKDGLSNTMMLIETGRNVGSWLQGGSPTVREVETDVPFENMHFRDPIPIWGSRPSGTHVELADGSVRRLSPGTSPDVLAALATIAGGETMPGDW